MNIMERMKKLIWGIVIILGCVGIDQITKVIARKSLQGKPSVPVIKDFFHFTYVENRGGAWGAFSGKLWLFIIITVFALGLMFYLMKDFDIVNNKLYSISICLIIAGAIGNFIDRIVFKYVTDFLDFYIFGYDFPVFNVADICITIGVAMLLVKIIFFYNSEPGATV